jgi:hypothetical protein
MALLVVPSASPAAPEKGGTATPSPAAATAAPAGKITLPTPEEWFKKMGRDPVLAIQKKPEELPLVTYREPEVQVLAPEWRSPCPEPRAEPVFEVLFGQRGTVEAIRQVGSNPCPPLVEAWKDSIITWRLRPQRLDDIVIPALIRIEVRFGARAPRKSD